MRDPSVRTMEGRLPWCDEHSHDWRYKVNDYMTCAEYLYLDKRCLNCGEGRQDCLPLDL